MQIGARCQRLNVVKTVLHQLRGFLEDNLLVRFRDQTLFAVRRRSDFPIDHRRLEQLENVIQSDRSLSGIVEIQLNDHLELAPSRFGHLIGWFVNDPIGISIAFVQFEMDFFNIRRHILIVEGFDVDVPLVRVAILLALFAEGSSNVPVHDWFDDGQSL